MNLAAPAIAKAVSELLKGPAAAGAGTRTGRRELQRVRAAVGGDREGEHQRRQPQHPAVLFHLGKYIPSGVPDTYGFNGFDPTQSTGDIVALSFAGGMGLQSVVRFHWNGNGVELIGNTG